MSAIYDNWERIVAAVLKREQFWQLCHEQSRSPSLSSDSSSGFSFSFCLNENGAPFSWSVSDQEEYEFGRESNNLVKDQSPVANLVPSKDTTFAQRRKRTLKIQVPKPEILDHVCFNLSPERLECRPTTSPRILSPRLTSPVSSSRVHSRTGGGHSESPQTKWPDGAKQKSYPLPLPPGAVSNSPPSSRSNSSATSPSTPLRSPGRDEDLKSPGTRWKKGRLLGRGPLGDVYIGFDSEKGEMCAMKEVKIFSGDAKSSARVWEKEISLLSTLKHPNIVPYYGSEMVDDKLYVYSEYVSGGSIYTILQQYGKLGESAIRNYTQQILSGLAYLHSRYIAHRDLKGATILVDPKGRVKLASFGLGKQIAGQYMSSLLMDSAYWMAPEVIMNPNERKLSSDIWSLGCTVLEMAQPPISQYKEVMAMFKIGNRKELPTIPDYLSDEGKDFVRLCLQRDPKHRATASQLLEHPFVKSLSLYPQMLVSASSVHPAAPNAIKSEGNDHARSLHQLDSKTLAIHSSRASKSNFQPRNKSTPVSPVGSPLPHPRSHLNQQMSPPPRSSLHKAASRVSFGRAMETASVLTEQAETKGIQVQIAGRIDGKEIACVESTKEGRVPQQTIRSKNGGISAIPYPHFNQSILPQEALRNLPKHSPTMNSPPYWDPNILRGVHSDHKRVSSDNNSIQKQFANGLLCEQSVLADRFFQQLHTAPVKSNTSTDRNPSSLFTSHRIG